MEKRIIYKVQTPWPYDCTKMVEIDQDSNFNKDEEQVTYVIAKGDMLTKDLFITNYTQK